MSMPGSAVGVTAVFHGAGAIILAAALGTKAPVVTPVFTTSAIRHLVLTDVHISAWGLT